MKVVARYYRYVPSGKCKVSIMFRVRVNSNQDVDVTKICSTRGEKVACQLLSSNGRVVPIGKGRLPRWVDIWSLPRAESGVSKQIFVSI